jgi:hypothetical protein
MVGRSIYLRPYQALLQEEGDLDCSLNDQQWLIITNLKFILQPFMISQRLLEGQLALFLIWYTRSAKVSLMILETTKFLIM